MRIFDAAQWQAFLVAGDQASQPAEAAVNREHGDVEEDHCREGGEDQSGRPIWLLHGAVPITRAHSG